MTRVNESLEQLRLGITVDPREVRPDPPLYVQQAFNEVLQAQQRGDIRIREAESYARGATNKAVGEASAIVRDALTRSNSLVTIVSAEAESFLGLLPSYQRNAELLRERLLAETTQRILTNAQFKAFLPRRADGQAREVRLLLNKEIEAPKTIEAPPSK
jgi:regulator of protease activity HflC (stomatin/prohibitin superfamily)